MKRLVRLYFGFQFFFSLLLWLPIFYEYQRRFGLSDAQVFGIQGLYYLFFCAFEIPTGWLADGLGHRLCLALASVILVVGNLLPAIVPTYGGFLAHFFLVAAARSLVSGAASAYLYDALQAHGGQAFYQHAEGRARAYSLAGKVACWAAIGPLMLWHVTLPYTLSAAAAAVGLGFALALPAPARARAAAGFSAGLAPAFRALRARPFIGLVMFQGVGVFVLARICQVNLFQPILGAKGFGVASYGVVMGAMTAFEAAGSYGWGWRARGGTLLAQVSVLTLAMAGALVVVAASGRVGAVAGLCAFAWACGAAFPVQRRLLNDAIPASGPEAGGRATLLSLESLLDRAVCAAVAPFLAGFVASGRTSVLLVGAAAAVAVMIAGVHFAAHLKK